MDYSRQTQHFSIITKGEIRSIPLENIFYFECDKSLIRVYHIENGTPYYFINSLKYIEEKLEEYGFLRISHNRLVNMKHVTYCNSTKRCLQIKNGITLNVSRRKWYKLRAYYK